MNKAKDIVNKTAQGFGDAEKARPLITAGAVSAVLFFLFLLFLFYSVPRNKSLTENLGELRLLSQTIARQATEATASGSKESIDKLKASQKQFNESLASVKSQHIHNADLQLIEKQWLTSSKNIDTITTNEKILNQLYDINVAIGQVVPGIQAQYNAMVDEMAHKNAPSSQIIIAKNQVFISEKILRSIASILTVSDTAKESADDFKEDTDTFGQYLNAQLNGDAKLGVIRIDDPDLRDQLDEMKTEYEQVIHAGAVTLFNNSRKVEAVQLASSQIFNESDSLLTNLNKLSASPMLTVYLPALLLILSFMMFLLSMYRLLILRGQADTYRMNSLQNEYDRNQNAILRLLDEIADLGDGDLRSYATVSEDFTGAIADSINFAIDQLRDLVSRINDTSQEVARYTQSTQNVTNQLAEASEHQAQEIAGASAAINEMAVSIDQVSENASESADVAKRSVNIAANGADVVNRSIEGMDTIREQIQETSKRIKRLGESSQEIGNIVALINDIADQTNILALNAAIQASMAGEAGRGFAVVADEVQRLAERSTSATKQIENLVKTIQADTNEAVISMESTTTEVVRGATLAKDAGIALDEIQSVSNTLAKLIENISSAAQLQSASASHIANTMNVVQEITSQTTTASFDTAHSVSELANMAESLRESVTDFKLPE
ncbi:methyl-accepting chemotaxis protein [Acinetobacter sp. MD2(2019)]|nr:methyl-accepting chemotaxis protein [Acinetobacter sp. MD2(2019)]MEB3754851.1 methyl-accepting chemotaxis protein [Acinetobacter sp. MD2(2019)]